MTARGVLTIADLRARSVRKGLCWLWQGAASGGHPRIWTFDHAAGDKRTMTGPRAVWNIAMQAAPPARLVFRCCGERACVNPAHLRLADDKASMFAALKRDGRFRGTFVAQRRANAELARIAAGITPTPAAIVAAIRAAPLRSAGGPTNIALAALHGITHNAVSQIRLGKSRRGAGMAAGP